MERFGGVASAMPQLRAVFEQLCAIAKLPDDVLLRGELATGRETLALGLHELSSPTAPFVIVDLTAIPPVLMESALFGYERGSFTGKRTVKKGVFEEARGGTLLLREIAAIPLDVQRHVWRALDRRETRRVGNNRYEPFQVRIVATTHANLEELVAKGWFLPGVLAGITKGGDLAVPPLRERIADLPALLADAGIALDGDLLARLSRLAWRGNFGQLQAFTRALGDRPAPAVTELELLQAIEDAPDDDGPRLVYADALAARDAPRAELIQLQCSPWRDRKVRRSEQQLLATHQQAWGSAAVAAASSSPITAEVTFVRGFVDRIAMAGESLRKLDAVLQAAPLVTRLAVRGQLGSDSWISPLLQRLRGLEVVVPALGSPEVAALAGCSYLTGVRDLTLGANPEAETTDSQPGIEALARSPHLAGVTRLALESFRLTADNLATLLDRQARWTLSELALQGAELGQPELEALVRAPKAATLQLLDLRNTTIRGAGATVLAKASLPNLTTLRLTGLSADARKILRASTTLGATIYDGNQVIR